MSRRGRKNWSNLKINKRICKQLILHRVWNKLSQRNLAEDIGTTFQQYQKDEKTSNRIYGEQLIAIFESRKWDPQVIMMANPEETLNEWIKSTSDSEIKTRKIAKIKNAWKLLETNGPKSYYGNITNHDTDHISNMKPIIPKGDY